MNNNQTAEHPLFECVAVENEISADDDACLRGGGGKSSSVIEKSMKDLKE